MGFVNPTGQGNRNIVNEGSHDPFDMDVRQFRSSSEGEPVNEATPTITTVPITAVTVSVTKYLVLTFAGAC